MQREVQQHDGRNDSRICWLITDKKRRKAILLHYAGEEVHDILTLAQDEEDPYKQALDALDAYFVPKRNKEYDIYRKKSRV